MGRVFRGTDDGEGGVEEAGFSLFDSKSILFGTGGGI
jgi:hypothetical protein